MDKNIGSLFSKKKSEKHDSQFIHIENEFLN